MKFLCDNCKAKYQIADEKVAGRTVRMKCRKCGHLIEIRASVTDTSVSKSVAGEDIASLAQSVGPPAVAEKKPLVPAPTRSGALPPRKPPVATPSGGKPATSPLRVAGGGAASPVKAGGVSAPAAPRPGGGLASAFSKSVKDEPAPLEDSQATRTLDARSLDPRSLDARALDMTSPASTEEWYVGVNGVPVGPVRLAELRAKAASGAVTEESLVWREGFEEWLPLRTFPDLSAIVRQAQGADRHSHTPPPGSTKPSSLSNPNISRRSSPPARSNVIPFSGRAATAEKLEEDEPATRIAMADPFAAPDPFAPPQVAAVAVPADPPSREDVAVASVHVPPAASLPADMDYEPRRRGSGGIPVAAWIAIVLAMATGVVAGSVFFAKSPPPPTVQIVTVTAPPPPVPTTSSSAATGGGPIEILPDPASSKAGGTRVAAGGTAPVKTADPGPVGNVPNIPSIPGPGITPGPGPGPSPGVADKLTSDDLQRVVAAGRNTLKRACWEPALAGKSSTAPNNAHVSVAITIGPDGRVQSAVPSGGEAFPTLGSCIAQRIRNWSFPQAAGTTSTTAAFNFVAQ